MPSPGSNVATAGENPLDVTCTTTIFAKKMKNHFFLFVKKTLETKTGPHQKHVVQWKSATQIQE